MTINARRVPPGTSGRDLASYACSTPGCARPVPKLRRGRAAAHRNHSRIGRRNRNRGSQVEREFKRYAESLGYLAVKAGGGSFGPIDVIAVPTNEAKRIDLPDLIAPNHTLLVQVKSGRMPGPKERAALLDIEDRCSARVVVALLNPGRRKAGVPRWRFLWSSGLRALSKEE